MNPKIKLAQKHFDNLIQELIALDCLSLDLIIMFTAGEISSLLDVRINILKKNPTNKKPQT